jgi:hypothetical protein
MPFQAGTIFFKTVFQKPVFVPVPGGKTQYIDKLSGLGALICIFSCIFNQ